MAVTSFVYRNGIKHLVNGDIVYKASGGSALKMALFPSTITINQDSDENISTYIASEITGTGYTARGAALTMYDPAAGSGSHQIKLDFADLQWTITGALSAGVRYGVIYKDAGAGNDSTSYLLACVNFGVDKAPEDGTLTITIPTNGQITLSAGAAS